MYLVEQTISENKAGEFIIVKANLDNYAIAACVDVCSV